MALSTVEPDGPHLVEMPTPSQPDDVDGNRVMHGLTPDLPGLRHFAAIRCENANVTWPLSPGEVSIQAGLFRDLLCLALQHVPVDENYYRLLYPDVGEAVDKGLLTSARHHYIEFGYFENRLPFRIEVDEEFYLRSYPDVRAAVDVGRLPSAQFHFDRLGYNEGRLPRESWSLLAG